MPPEIGKPNKEEKHDKKTGDALFQELIALSIENGQSDHFGQRGKFEKTKGYLKDGGFLGAIKYLSNQIKKDITVTSNEAIVEREKLRKNLEIARMCEQFLLDIIFPKMIPGKSYENEINFMNEKDRAVFISPIIETNKEERMLHGPITIQRIVEKLLELRYVHDPVSFEKRKELLERSIVLQANTQIIFQARMDAKWVKRLVSIRVERWADDIRLEDTSRYENKS